MLGPRGERLRSIRAWSASTLMPEEPYTSSIESATKGAYHAARPANSAPGRAMRYPGCGLSTQIAAVAPTLVAGPFRKMPNDAITNLIVHVLAVRARIQCAAGPLGPAPGVTKIAPSRTRFRLHTRRRW